MGTASNWYDESNLSQGHVLSKFTRTRWETKVILQTVISILRFLHLFTALRATFSVSSFSREFRGFDGGAFLCDVVSCSAFACPVL